MKRKRDIIFWWVVGLHVGAVLILLVSPAFKQLFHPKPKELIHFVEFISEPPASAQPVAAPQPAATPPPVEAKPVVEPPKPKAVPAPEKPKPVPVTPKPTPVKPKLIPVKPKPAAVKPAWKPAPVVRQNNRVVKQSTAVPAPVQKQITRSDIRSALGAGGTIDPFGSYYQTIFARFYAVWQVPIGSAYGLSAQAVITVGTDGSVSNRRIIRSSGQAAYDQSVQRALNAVNRLPAPPQGLPSRTITIEFVPQS